MFFADLRRPFDVVEAAGEDAGHFGHVFAGYEIARVFYAAAASRATRITARPTVEHVGYCRTYGSGVCPACQGEQNTVFERTVA